jgi:hypothetical protein
MQGETQLRKTGWGIAALIAALVATKGMAAGQTQFIPRPIPMGVAGGNGGYNTEKASPQCLASEKPLRVVFFM